MMIIIVLAILNLVQLAAFILFFWKVYLPLNHAVILREHPEIAGALVRQGEVKHILNSLDTLKEKQDKYYDILMSGASTEEEAAEFLDEEMHPNVSK